jgi:WD40 repeat protein
MASASTKAEATKLILKPSITLKGHRRGIESISNFPDGQRMISGSWDKTARQWDLETGKEIEEARGVCEGWVLAVAVSRNGRWIATGGDRGELKACEVETGMLKTFKGHSTVITCVDISADSTQLASGSWDYTARDGIWTQANSWLVHSRATVGWAQFDSPPTQGSWQSSQIRAGAWKSGMSNQRNWM